MNSMIRAVAVVVVVLAGLVTIVGSGGGGTEDIPPLEPDTGVEIVSPTIANTYQTDRDSVELLGSSFIPGGAQCTGIVGTMPAGYAVTFINVANSVTGSASFYLGCLLQVHVIWETAAIPLEMGHNTIVVTASDATGRTGEDSIDVIRIPDTTPPAVTSAVPGNGWSNVSVTVKPEIAFSEDMNAATINGSTITLKDGSGNPVPTSVTYYYQRATIVPNSSLAYSTLYEITVTTGVQDKAGNPLPAPYVTSFTTGANPDTTPPYVESVSPPAGSDCAPVSGTVSATFSEELYPPTVNDTTFLLKNDLGQAVPGLVSYSDRVASFTPSGSLPTDASFTATLTAGIEDLSGNAMPANYEWSFTTPPSTVFGTWTSTALTGAPFERSGHVAAWTGSEMIIAGGLAWDTDWGRFAYTDQYGRFNPGTNSWTLSRGAPPGMFRSSIWTGTEMIAWGGYQDGVALGNGARYNQSTNSWQPVQSAGAPSARYDHTAVWTGTEMIVWGGRRDYYSALGDGARYNPSTDSWQPVQSMGAPSARYGHTAVWTGTEMIVWGGIDEHGLFRRDGARYNPQTDTWTPVTLVNAPSERAEHVAVWTGIEMIVWGDEYGSVNTGGRYNPVSDTWSPTNATCAPTGRWNAPAVWSGSRMIIWGGQKTSTYLGDGYEYDPLTDTWQMMATQNAPTARASHTALWTGSKLIIWGGTDGGLLGDGGVFTP